LKATKVVVAVVVEVENVDDHCPVGVLEVIAVVAAVIETTVDRKVGMTR